MPVRSEIGATDAVPEISEDENIIPVEMVENIQNKLLLNSIQHCLFNIEQCYFNPQVLTIEGYKQLRCTPGQHWKSRMYTLFCDAYLPHYWILDIWKSRLDNTDEVPNTVFVQFITFQAKMFVKNTLTDFFSTQNTNINVYD
jgi:hypothetical protein